MIEYIRAALRTESLEHFKVDNPRILHAVIGLSTELHEVLLSTDDLNEVEEIGDLLWYLAIFADEVEASFDEMKLLAQETLPDVVTSEPQVLLWAIAEALNLQKRALFYGVPLDELQITRYLGRTLIILEKALVDAGHSLKMAMDANIAKLQKRYPEKFTPEAAVERDIEAEIQVLKDILQ
jgi:NTP pyrophosphatase (non-canonical NTP hydrolase)